MKNGYPLIQHVCGCVILLALLMAAGPVRALESVTLQLRWKHQFQFAGYYAALAKGFYREEGLEVALIEGGPGADPVSKVLDEQADFGIGVSSLVIDYLKGKPVLMLGPIFQHSPNVLIVHGRDKRPVDLAGSGKIAMMAGDQDVELKAMFIDEGVSLDKLHIVPDDGHMDDFFDRNVEALNAYSSNEPFSLIQLGIPHTIMKPISYGMDFYGDVLFTRRRLAEQKPTVVAAFRRAALRGWQYALDHPAEIIDLIDAHYNSQGKSREHLAYEARELHRLINPEIIDIGHNNPGRWRHIANTYARFGLVPAGLPLEEFFYQPDPKVDFSWLYRALAVSIGFLLVVVAIALYIHRMNRRLSIAIADKTRSEERHRVIFQTSPSAGMVWCDGYIVTDWNSEAEAVFGWKREEVLGKPFTEFLLPTVDQARLEPALSQMVHKNVLPHSINNNLTRDGRQITCEWFNAWLPERPGENREVVSLARDITERQRLEEEVRQLAFYDPLTHLPNRRLLQDRLGRVLAATQRDRGFCALMFLDLDNFKPLNDRHGHDVGDRLLVEVARRLSDCVRTTDTVARFGGDEFVVLLSELDETKQQASEQAAQVAYKILECLSEPYHLAGSNGSPIVEHRCSASIGVAIFAGDADSEDVMRRADTAMFCAKESGRNRVTVDSGDGSAMIQPLAIEPSHRRLVPHEELQ
ncbi:diguanylate cyclase domain-containing protein [Magnetospirillum gryphiswaldense]|nr:diguanylate cyclase [Magnetospirillum gryphiswaldense]